MISAPSLNAQRNPPTPTGMATGTRASATPAATRCTCRGNACALRPERKCALEYPLERLVIEVDAADREHSIFYARQHFAVTAAPGGGYKVAHTSTSDPAVTSSLDVPFGDSRPESLHHVAAAIRYVIDGGLAGGVLPATAWPTPQAAQGLDIG